MNTMEVLTLLLVVFASLSYLDILHYAPQFRATALHFGRGRRHIYENKKHSFYASIDECFLFSNAQLVPYTQKEISILIPPKVKDAYYYKH